MRYNVRDFKDKCSLVSNTDKFHLNTSIIRTLETGSSEFNTFCYIYKTLLKESIVCYELDAYISI